MNVYVCVYDPSGSGAVNTSVTTATTLIDTSGFKQDRLHTRVQTYTSIQIFTLDRMPTSKGIFMQSFGMIQLSNLHWWEQTDNDKSKSSASCLVCIH